MRAVSLVTILSLVGFAAAPAARAQDVGAAAREDDALTLDDAQAAAEADAPAVASSSARVAIAHADTGIAGMFPNPRLGIGGGVNYLVVADFFILLPIFGQRETTEEAASAEERAVEAGVAVTRLDARLAAALAWIELWSAERDIGLASEDATRRDTLHDIAVARFEEGDGTELDVLRTRADALRAHAESRALEGARSAARARLSAALGASEVPAWATVGEPTPDAIELPALGDLDTIVASHPVALRFGASSHAADAGVERAHRARWPLFGISVSDWVSRATESSDLRVLVTFEVPIFDEPRIERAEAVRDAARADADGAMVLLRAGVVAARAELEATLDRCASEEGDVLPATREAADLAVEAYESGALDLSGTLSAAQLRLEAERRVLRCSADRGRGWARLEHAMGGPHA